MAIHHILIEVLHHAGKHTVPVATSEFQVGLDVAKFLVKRVAVGLAGLVADAILEIFFYFKSERAQ